MSATRRPVEALRYAREMVKSSPLNRPEIAVSILQGVSNQIWMAAPWRWTVGRLSDTTLTADTVAHTLTSTPTDILYLGQVVLDDGESIRPLEIVPELPSTKTLAGTPLEVAFVSPATLRVQPPVTQLGGNKTWTIRGWYKKVAPTINEQTQYTAGRLTMDDEWFQVYEAGVLWQAYLYSDDVRAGQTQVGANGQTVYTGQMGAFYGGLAQMRQSEPLPDLTKPYADLKKQQG